jgi:hypothetical protein
MRYLAQVNKLAKYHLRLLARQESENIWAIIPEEVFVPLKPENDVHDNLLVLVELSSSGEIENLEDATNWVIHLVQTYLTQGITPEFLQQEAERAESWRQSLTVQNQDLGRRTLELETRREQIQALEESLKREKEELEAHRQQVQALEESIKSKLNGGE